MNARELLESFKKLESELNQIRKQIEELRSSIDSIQAISYDKERVQTSGISNVVENFIIKSENLIDILIKKQEEVIENKQTIIDMINTLDDSKLIEVLHRRYIDLMSFNAIAKSMNYTERNVFKLHKQALLELEKKLYID